MKTEGGFQGAHLPGVQGPLLNFDVLSLEKYVAYGLTTTDSQRKGKLARFAVSQGKKGLFCQGNNNTQHLQRAFYLQRAFQTLAN